MSSSISDQSAQDNFEAFKTLLTKNYNFPADYIHKFIGKNTEAFKASIDQLELKFKDLTQKSERLSQNSAHLALTYIFKAQNADHVVNLMIETKKMNDLLFIL